MIENKIFIYIPDFFFLNPLDSIYLNNRHLLASDHSETVKNGKKNGKLLNYG